jgi:hypothetical protein
VSAADPDSNAVVVAERIPASDDTDSLTKSTIGKMCEYIQAGSKDSNVRGCAQYAAQRFGLNRNQAASLGWGVFWFLKHRVRKVLDEGNAFRVGESNAADMLIAPAVLLRMDNPAEDCDGFTMAAAAMLKALGVEQCIVTIACDAHEPQRWSHVFGMVHLENGEWMPLDCSHGTAPGWMVPQHRITRWQAWDLSGNPIDVAMPARSNMRGYRRRGVGQICTDSYGNIVDCSDSSSGTLPVSTVPIATESPYPVVLDSSSSTSPTSGLTPAQIAALINTGLINAARVAQTAELPAGASLTSTGQVIGAGASLSTGSIVPIILLVVGAVLLVSLMEAGQK